jgi:hypothetical protein
LAEREPGKSRYGLSSSEPVSGEPISASRHPAAFWQTPEADISLARTWSEVRASRRSRSRAGSVDAAEDGALAVFDATGRTNVAQRPFLCNGVPLQDGILSGPVWVEVTLKRVTQTRPAERRRAVWKFVLEAPFRSTALRASRKMAGQLLITAKVLIDVVLNGLSANRTRPRFSGSVRNTGQNEAAARGGRCRMGRRGE